MASEKAKLAIAEGQLDSIRDGIKFSQELQNKYKEAGKQFGRSIAFLKKGAESFFEAFSFDKLVEAFKASNTRIDDALTKHLL